MNEIRARAGAFVRDWADSPGDERQDAQSFVRDLLAVYGVTATRAAFYEKRVKRAATGTQRYIDALVPGVALIEMDGGVDALLDLLSLVWRNQERHAHSDGTISSISELEAETALAAAMTVVRWGQLGAIRVAQTPPSLSACGSSPGRVGGPP